MTVTVLLSTTGAQTWVPASDCPPGTSLHIEGWAGGAGAGGTTTNGSGGAGGGFSSTDYTVVAGDVTGGIAYNIGTGSAGTGASNPTAGGDTTFGTAPKNLIPNSSMFGAVVAGAFPTGWTTVPHGLTVAVAGLGFDATTGFNYIDISFTGTLSGTNFQVFFQTNSPSGCSGGFAPALSYTYSGYLMLQAGALTNVTSIQCQLTTYRADGTTFISSLNAFTISGTPPSIPAPLTQHSGTVTSPALAVMGMGNITFNAPTSSAISFTVRLAGFQIEQAAAASSYQKTPTSYVLAKGGAGPITTAGGIAPDAGNGYGTQLFKGGNGAAFNASGSGGGGAAGKAGNGNVGSIAGVGGQGDSSSGGAGGIRKTTSPGNPGIANVEGGGGGGAVITATSATGGAGGVPGGGAGAAETTSSTGGTGANGQIRLTYTPFNYVSKITGLQPILAQ